MNPFIRRMAIVLMLACVFALHAASASLAALAPEVNYLGRISGVIAPVRLAADPFGKLYVADPRSGGVLQFDNTGKSLKSFPVKGARGVAITSVGELVVTHGSSASVINTETGATHFTLGPFKKANGVTVDDAGRIFVVDTLDSVVKVFVGAGQSSTFSFGNTGTAVEKLSLPTAIAFDAVSKQIIVADTGNSRLAFFDMNGAFIRAVGGKSQNGTAPVFTSPQSVALEYTKNNPQKLQRIYVSDSFQSEVQIIDPQDSGTSLGRIGGYGTGAGKLKVPVDALFDAASSRLLVANGAGEITLFGINVTAPPQPDITPPDLTLDTPPAVVSTNAVVIGGSVEKEALVQITAPQGVVVGAVNYYPSPNNYLLYWQAGLSNLVVGPNEITVTARDAALNPAIAKATITYSPNTVKVSIADVTEPISAVTYTLSGTADAGTTVVLKGDGLTFTPNSFVQGASAWYSSVSGLKEGINTITATATAADGISSSSATTRITVLLAKPTLEVSTLPNGSKTAQAVLNVSGRVLNNSYFASLRVAGKVIPVVNGAFSTSVTLNPGANTITTVGRDKAGNETTDSRVIIFDDTLPTVTITVPSDGAYVNGTDVNVKGVVKPGNTVQLALYNGSVNGTVYTAVTSADGSWQSATPVQLDPGLNTITATVTEPATGKSSTSKLTVTRDANAPALATTEPKSDISVNKVLQTVVGTVTPGSEIHATLNGITIPVTMDANGSSYSITVTFSEGEKQYSLAITATDALGNSITTFRNIIYDITSPGIPTGYAVSPYIVTFSEGTPKVFYDSVELQLTTDYTITQNSDGSKTVEVKASSASDPKKLNIYAVDPAGNSSRNGDADGNSKVDIADAMKILRFSLGLDVPGAEHKFRGDVAPLLSGVSKPDGVLNVFDVIYLLEKIVGLR